MSLTLLAVGLTIWLCLGALVAQLFGAFVDGGWQSREDDRGQPTQKAGRAHGREWPL